MTEFKYNDGGRELSGFKGDAGDCVCRAISIAAELPYLEVYKKLSEGNANQRSSKHTKKGAKSARNGIYTGRKWFKEYMADLGFTWTPTMFIGSGCTTHLKSSELPSGRIICSVSKHWVSVIDGVINDTYNCSREETRCVYGYWVFTKL